MRFLSTLSSLPAYSSFDRLCSVGARTLGIVPSPLPSAAVTCLDLHGQRPYARRARVTDCTLYKVPSWSLVMSPDSGGSRVSRVFRGRVALAILLVPMEPPSGPEVESYHSSTSTASNTLEQDCAEHVGSSSSTHNNNCGIRTDATKHDNSQIINN